MAYQFRIVAEIEQLAARLTAPLHSAWRGRPGSEARRALGKIGFWIAQPGLDAACQRQLVALQRSRREVADVATAAKRVELQIAELVLPTILGIPQCRSLKFPSWLSAQRVVAEASGWRACWLPPV